MKAWAKHVVIFLLGAGVLGVILMISGVIPVNASSGHWKITSLILSFSMSRSVSTYSLPLSAPDLNKEWMALKGAGHFEIGCSFCHSNPATPGHFIGNSMTPQTPRLEHEIDKWSDEELFYIVKHGVKFTAMPAWPDLERDDEVWSMVAFLRKYSSLDAKGYLNLVHEESYSNVDNELLKECIDCHGVDGNGRGLGAFPKLAGQPVAYLQNSLKAYFSDQRKSGIMKVAVNNLNQEQMAAFSKYFSSQNLKPHSYSIDKEAIERGKLIANQGIPSQKVATCAACHGPDKMEENPLYPNLAGQYSEYLILQLELFKKGERGGTRFADLMHEVVERMDKEEIRAVALYYESLVSHH